MDDKTRKRLGKALDKKRSDLDGIHVKDDYAEVTDGRMLIQEKVENPDGKDVIVDAKTGDEKKTENYPDTKKVLLEIYNKPTVLKIKFSRDLMKKFLDCIPAKADLTFEFKGPEDAATIKVDNCDKQIRGVILPMKIWEEEKESEDENN